MTIFTIIAALALLVYTYMQQAKFGKKPSGERLERMKRSPHFKDGQFQNLNLTPALSEGVSYYAVLKEFLFAKNKSGVPVESMPSKKIDLHALAPEENVLIWFGHSSYFMQVDGKKILVDPVLSGNASPLSFTTKSFAGTDVYTVDDLPPIDFLFISHDHYDHLDYRTIVSLQSKVGKVICGLGTGAHLEYWGYGKGQLLEEDWNTELELADRFKVAITPARHFSGRGFKRNGTLWVSFVLQSPSFTIYLGGDSGYDSHFKAIGEKYGPFDLAILECGQYDKSWKYIHMMPEEVLMAAQDLKAAALMPVHWGKFQLANHAWNDPILRISLSCEQANFPVFTPMIGEVVNLNDSLASTAWWKDLI